MRGDIVSLALKPGEVIKDNELAERYGVSTSPIREALTQLVLENLVEVLPNKRKRVTPLDASSVRDYFGVHKILIYHGFAWGAPNITADGLRIMKSAYERMERACLLKEYDPFNRLIRVFLDPVYRASGNREILKRIIQSSPWMERIDFINRHHEEEYEYKRAYSSRIYHSLMAGDFSQAILHQRELTEEYERNLYRIDFSAYSANCWGDD